MRRRLRNSGVGLFVMVLALTAAPVLVASPAGAATTQLFTIRDPRIDEASGIARGRVSPGVFYVQNDSGDTARVFAVDARTGVTRTVLRIPGAHNVDWEDLAVAPDLAGVSSLWIADIGDNQGVRSQVDLYRVDEPRVSGHGHAMRATKPEVWRLRYPHGAVNAESLAVVPGGRAFLITKSASGHSVVLAVPAHPDANAVQKLTRVGAITFRPHASLLPAQLQVQATGAAFSADGSLLVVRTYSDAYLWRVHGDHVARALRAAPVRVVLPLQLQGEGICIDRSRLVIDSEHAAQPVDAIGLPRGFASSVLSRSQPTSSGFAALSLGPSPSGPSSPSKGKAKSPTGVAVGALLVVALLFVTLRRRRWRPEARSRGEDR